MNGHGSPAGRRGIALRRSVPYVLLVVASALSVYAAFYVSSAGESRRRDRFFADASEIRQRVEARFETYVEVVRDGTALLAASNEIHLGEFRAFVRRLELRDRYPGIGGIGFAQRVSHRQLGTFLRAMDLDGAGPLTVRPAGDRPDYEVVVFFEPMADGNREWLGADMSADPEQRDVMDRARDSGEPAISGRTGAEAGDRLILYVPVYRSGAPVATVDERRRALYGFVFSPIQAGALFDGAAARSLNAVTFEVYDGIEANVGTLMHQSADPTPQPEYTSSGPLSVAGRTWLLTVKSVDAVPALVPRPVRSTLAVGLLLSVILFLIAQLQVRAWESARRHADEMHASEQALRTSEARLREALAREQAAREHAQAADRAKEDFLMAASHELRTPITAMLGWLTMLKKGTIREDQRGHALAVVERNAQVQARLIEDLLDLSRILQGRMSVDLQPLDVVQVAAMVVEALRPIAVGAGVQLYPPTLGARGAIQGDAARVQQIFWNLISNAIKFTPSGGHVFVDVTEADEWVELRVTDTGAGIDPEFLPRVFERFSQAEAAARQAHGGLGLGMAITRHLVELHNGTVEAHSAGRSRGAAFVVRLPSLSAVSGSGVSDESAYGTATPLAS